MHSVADISDPLSHGVIGDGLLSVNEAIQLHNRTLLPSQLSLAEQAQLSGAGSDISWINIDASWTPTITVERDFDVILDFPHGCLIQAFNGEAEIDFRGPALLHGFRSVSNFCNWRNLILRGGNYGIDLQQTDASFGGTVLDNVQFDGQTQFGFAVSGLTTNGYGRVLFDRCKFANMPAAIRCDESGSGRTTVLVGFDIDIRAVMSGIDLLLGSGGAALVQFDRVVIAASGTAVDLRRATLGDRPLTLAITHLRADANRCVRIAGSVAGTTTIDAHMLDLTAAVGGTSLELGPLGTSFAGQIEDTSLRGPVVVAAGTGSSPVLLSNLRMSNGSVTLGSSGASIQVRATRFDNCAVSTLGSSAVAADDSCFLGGTIQGGSAASPLQVQNSFVGAAVGPHVVASSSIAAAQLGSSQITPQVATTGTVLSLSADLPAGYFGLFVIGPTLEAPLYVSPDLHVFLDLANSITVPGVVFGLQSLMVTVPNDPVFWNTDWVVQMAALAGAGVPGSALHVPPGQRFVILP